MIKDVSINSLRTIPDERGSIKHMLKCTDKVFTKFGEVYFSEIRGGFIKAWKKHSKMTLRLVVPVGMVRFVFFDKSAKRKLHDVSIGRDKYSLITVPPGIWFGFRGISFDLNLVMNIADIVHDPNEVEQLDLDAIEFNWGEL